MKQKLLLLFFLLNSSITLQPCWEFFYSLWLDNVCTKPKRFTLYPKLPTDMKREICNFTEMNTLHEKWPPLQEAVCLRDSNKTQILIALGADINGTTSKYPNTPLIESICLDPIDFPEFKEFKKSFSIFIYLLKHGADYNKPGEDNETPLHKIARFGNISALQKLLEKKPDLNPVDTWGDTPLDLSISLSKSHPSKINRQNNLIISRILQKAGATSKYNLTPLPSDEITLNQYNCKKRRYIKKKNR